MTVVPQPNETSRARQELAARYEVVRYDPSSSHETHPQAAGPDHLDHVPAVHERQLEQPCRTRASHARRYHGHVVNDASGDAYRDGKADAYAHHHAPRGGRDCREENDGAVISGPCPEWAPRRDGEDTPAAANDEPARSD